MKLTFKFGKLFHRFSILPTIDITYFDTTKKKIYSVHFTWFFWYVVIGKVDSYLDHYWGD